MHKTALQFNSKQSIILVDASYYVFYRYFATMRWFTFKKIEFDVETIIENTEFVSSFVRHLDADIRRICKKWKTIPDNIIFCADCQRCKIWRNDVYKEYKSNRIQNTNFNGKIFNVFTEQIAQYNMKHIWMDRLEADDIIYLMQAKLKQMTSMPLVIITNDNDYLQLAGTGVNIINMQFKDITLRGTNDPRMDLYYKAIYGDKSDNIQKIAPSITKDKALALSKMNDDELNVWLRENDMLDKFRFNMQLICFENIPSEYVKKFNDKIAIEIM